MIKKNTEKSHNTCTKSRGITGGSFEEHERRVRLWGREIWANFDLFGYRRKWNYGFEKREGKRKESESFQNLPSETELGTLLTENHWGNRIPLRFVAAWGWEWWGNCKCRSWRHLREFGGRRNRKTLRMVMAMRVHVRLPLILYFRIMWDPRYFLDFLR